MALKEARGISGIYFRSQNPETEKWENRVFEDLPESEQDRVMEGRSEEWLKNLAKILANKLYSICQQFDITTVQPDNTEL